ncbi:Hypothetical predicted protein [Octopus vulgaris]|uniref:HMG box domain-containing protein n=1 Tax=Octopus vulgaris TaxID=6645 RepID=A0AA36AWK5_OCTVU|nr:Hypothetical predicted protein [Octopus vulgaris]
MAIHLTNLVSKTLDTHIRRTCVHIFRLLSTFDHRSSDAEELPKPPKKPYTMFFEFLDRNRQAVVSNNPGIKNPEVISLISNMYRNLSEADKTLLREESVKRFQAYKEEYVKFKASLSPQQLQAMTILSQKKKASRLKREKKRAEKKYGHPQRPISSYGVFVRENKGKRGNMGFAEFSKYLSRIWKEMSDKEKSVYHDMSLAERERYAVQMVDWEQLMLEEGRPELIRGYKKTKQKKAKTKPKTKTKTKAKKKRKTKKKTSKKNLEDI